MPFTIATAPTTAISSAAWISATTFNIDQWVWGFKADYDAVGNKSYNRSYTYTGIRTPARYPIPNGTYALNGKVSPNGIGLLGPRVGYAFDQWLPYFRAGAAFAGGQHTGTLSSLRRPDNRLQRRQHQRRQELQVQRLECRRRP